MGEGVAPGASTPGRRARLDAVGRAAPAGRRRPGPAGRPARCCCSTNRGQASTTRRPPASSTTPCGGAGGRTVVVVTHRRAEAERVGTVVEIDAGRVVARRSDGERGGSAGELGDGRLDVVGVEHPARPPPSRSGSASPVERWRRQASPSSAPRAQATAALMGDTWLTTTTSPPASRAPGPIDANSSSQAPRPAPPPRPGTRHRRGGRRDRTASRCQISAGTSPSGLASCSP